MTLGKPLDLFVNGNTIEFCYCGSKDSSTVKFACIQNYPLNFRLTLKIAYTLR